MPWPTSIGFRNYYRRRIKEGRCVKCGEKHAPDYTRKTCQDCLKALQDYHKLKPHKKPVEKPEPSEAIRVQPGNRCPVCALLEPHVCIQASAHDRPGPGRQYPEGGC